MGTNSPTGSISLVTTQKVARPTAVTPSQARQPARPAMGSVNEAPAMAGSSREMPRVMICGSR